MIKIENKEQCCGCTACYSVCPKKCIKMIQDSEGFFYPSVGEDCINCGLCERVCPFKRKEVVESLHEAYAAKVNDDSVRCTSSSGGVFSALASSYIKKGGLVFGAVLSENSRVVEHTCLDCDLQTMKGSKYVQSNMRDCYNEVRSALEQGKSVMFSGVPCQIAGLKSFLNQDYDNLVCIDVICHGVPSPLLWKMYVDYLEKKEGNSISNICFRDKKKGWNNFGFSYIVNGTQVYENREDNPFMRMFLSNVSLRPSCYRCTIKNTGSLSDITIGDFWGIRSFDLNFDDNKGTSLVIVNTAVGKELFFDIAVGMQIKQVKYDSAIRTNEALFRSVSIPRKRKHFFKQLRALDFESLMIESRTYTSIKNRRSVKEVLASSILWKVVRPYIKNSANVLRNK